MHHLRTNRLEDIGDIACCVVLASLSLATTVWLWWALMLLPTPR